MSVYYMSGTILGTGDATVNQTGKTISPHGA